MRALFGPNPRSVLQEGGSHARGKVKSRVETTNQTTPLLAHRTFAHQRLFSGFFRELLKTQQYVI
jgi:sortase (surface protein transpeptidase)